MHDLLNNNFFIQLLGLVAAGFYIALFQVNNRKMMLTLKISGALLFTLHLTLLGAATGAAMTLVGVGRDSTYLYLGKKRNQYVPAFFIIIFSIAAITTWQGPVSLLALGGMVAGTLAFWQIKPSNIRFLALIASLLWIIYDLISGSYPGMFIEMTAIISNLIGIYRFDSKKGG